MLHCTLLFLDYYSYYIPISAKIRKKGRGCYGPDKLFTMAILCVYLHPSWSNDLIFVSTAVSPQLHLQHIAQLFFSKRKEIIIGVHLWINSDTFWWVSRVPIVKYVFTWIARYAHSQWPLPKSALLAVFGPYWLIKLLSCYTSFKSDHVNSCPTYTECIIHLARLDQITAYTCSFYICAFLY